MNKTKLDANAEKVLTYSEERKIVKSLYKNDREAFKQALITHNEKLVLKFAHKYQHAAEYDDLVQQGMYGLAIAADRFDPYKKSNSTTSNQEYVKFSVYAFMWIKKYVLNFIYDKIKNANISDDGKTPMLSINMNVTGSDSSETKELESILNVNEEHCSLSPSAEVQKLEMEEILYNVLSAIPFTEKEEYVLTNRILTDDKIKLSDISAKFKCSISNIKAIEYKIYKMIKSEFAKREINAFEDIQPQMI